MLRDGGKLGFTLRLMLSTSLGFVKVAAEVSFKFLFFLHGNTWNSFESGGIIFTHLVTLSLFLRMVRMGFKP
jgi:hypothetical protein